jgi:hypothetical protein
VEILPESLEVLALRACVNEIYAVINGLFERRRQGGLEKLKKVTLYFQKVLAMKQTLADEDGVRCESEGRKLGILVTSLQAKLFY